MDSRSNRWRPFAFDGVHGVDATQSEVFTDLASMSSLVVDGYCCGVLAYGQTGSGKTYTMQGTPTDPGINQKTLSKGKKKKQSSVGDIHVPPTLNRLDEFILILPHLKILKNLEKSLKNLEKS